MHKEMGFIVIFTSVAIIWKSGLVEDQRPENIWILVT